MSRAVVVALGVAWSGAAWAQGCPGDVVTGTVGYDLMHGAIQTNARVYGAAALLEDHLLPVLELADVGAAHYTVTAAPGLLRVPICPDGGPRTELGAIDISAGAFGAAAKAGPFSFFLSGSSATHALAPTAWNERAVTPFLGAGMILAAPVAFYQREFGGDGLSFTFDAMLGVQLDTPYLQATGAYVASRGGYLNLGNRRIRAFVGSVLRPVDKSEGVKTDLTDALPYVRAGFSDLDWLVGEDVAERAGSTALFLRRLQYQGAGPTDPNAGNALSYTPFTTLHLQQYQLLGHVDLAVAAELQPQVTLNEAMLGVSTGTALPESVVVSRLARDGIPDGEWGGVRFQAGVVNLPTTWYYGSGGGMRFRWNIDWNAAGHEADGYRLFFMSIGMNHPDTLANFPYAAQAGYLSISGSFL